MAVKRVIECDGPGCSFSNPYESRAEPRTPYGWYVVTLRQEGITKSVKRCFHSLDCLKNYWKGLED